MEKVESLADIGSLGANRMLGDFSLERSRIVFNGSGALVVTPPGTRPLRLEDSRITLEDGALVYLDVNDWHGVKLDLSVHRGSAVYIGKHSYFNTTVTAVVTEHAHLFVGNRCLFSREVWIRTSDAHGIFDAGSHQRINPGSSVMIGDHAWIGQGAMLLKGSRIGSGAIVGAGAVVPGREVGSNTAWAGNPARLVRKGVFFTSRSVHGDGPDDQEHATYPSEEFLYSHDSGTFDFAALDAEIRRASSVEERAALFDFLSANEAPNRFYVAG